MKKGITHYSYFFLIKKIQIPFVLFLALLGFVIGFFAVPQKHCYQAHCSIDKAHGATLYQSNVPTVLISEEHLQGLVSCIDDEEITYELLRKSIVVDLPMMEENFTVIFSVFKYEYVEKIGNAFESFTISYLNEKVPALKQTLQIKEKNYFKTSTIGNEALSGLLSAAAVFVFSYFLIVTINLYTTTKKKDN